MGQRKSEKRKRIKRLGKGVEGLNEQREKHLWKVDHEKGRKDTTPDYWKAEAEEYKRQADEKLDKIKKLRKKKVKR